MSKLEFDPSNQDAKRSRTEVPTNQSAAARDGASVNGPAADPTGDNTDGSSKSSQDAPEQMADARLYSSAFERNIDPISHALSEHFNAVAKAGVPRRLLEIGSGSGQHICRLARAQPNWTFHPSDPEPDHRLSCDAWVAHVQCANVAPACEIALATGVPPAPDDQTFVRIKTGARTRRDGDADAGYGIILCVNVLHISPNDVTTSLLAFAARHLHAAGRLIIYGPFRQGSAPVAPSNEAFDRALRAQDAAWGLRDTEVIAAEAKAHGFHADAPQIITMPANNLLLILPRDIG